MYVIKSSGEREKFSDVKIFQACLNSGTDENLCKQVTELVKKQCYNGIRTTKIFNLILKSLNTSNPTSAIRYNLKNAILNLGPAGFVFEKFIVFLLKKFDYSAWRPDIINGACVSHEIDIIAKSNKHPELLQWKNNINKNTYMIECKYHNAFGIRSGIKETLYTWARFLDIRDGFRQGNCERFHFPWLISNTKFSNSAKQYSECKGIRLLGWKYPEKQGLEKLIEQQRAYPITILKGLDTSSRNKLFLNNIIFCEQLISIKGSNAIKKININQVKLEKLITQARLIA
ncbi:hypothetical protein ISS06_01590 [Patescibacteria group bacterium]|nr:hypothetical protein [Patescibacteria group bacterium]